jgi:hypothetical protein
MTMAALKGKKRVDWKVRKLVENWVVLRGQWTVGTTDRNSVELWETHLEQRWVELKDQKLVGWKEQWKAGK